MKPTIAHSMPCYLFRMGSWIYGQITNFNKYRSIVIADKTENLQLFPFHHLYYFGDSPKPMQFIDRVRRRLFDNKFYDYYYRVLKKNNTLLIHSHFGTHGFEDMELSKKLKIPHVTNFYGADASQVPIIEPMWRERYLKLFKESDLFIVEGNCFKQSLVNLGCSEEKVVVNHLGVHLNQISYFPRIIEADQKIKILIAGTFRQKKGIPYAVEAFAKLSKKFPKLELKIVGDALPKPGDKEEKEEILSLIKQYDISGRVKLYGFVDPKSLHEIASQCHIFISPSVHANDGDNEGGAPVSIIEMSAAGMPVVSTYHCDIPEVIIDGKTGLLAEEKDVSGLVDRMEYLVENPNRWEEMGKLGRKHIEKEYNVTKQVPKLENIYDEVLRNT